MRNDKLEDEYIVEKDLYYSYNICSRANEENLANEKE